jgi:hypothetical protein
MNLYPHGPRPAVDHKPFVVGASGLLFRTIKPPGEETHFLLECRGKKFEDGTDRIRFIIMTAFNSSTYMHHYDFRGQCPVNSKRFDRYDPGQLLLTPPFIPSDRPGEVQWEILLKLLGWGKLEGNARDEIDFNPIFPRYH